MPRTQVRRTVASCDVKKKIHVTCDMKEESSAQCKSTMKHTVTEPMDREELRKARLARLAGVPCQSGEIGGPADDTAKPSSSSTELKREDIKEIERILILEWCDERHNSATTLVSRAKRLVQIISNAATGDEDRFRRLRYNNPVVQKEILACPPSEKLLRAIGWISLVEGGQRFLVWKHEAGSKEAQLAERLIERLKDIQEKEQLRVDLKEKEKADTQARLQRARTMLDDDHEARKEKHARIIAEQSMATE